MNWFDVHFMCDFNWGAKLFRLNLQADDAEQAIRDIAGVVKKIAPGILWRAKAFPSEEKNEMPGLAGFQAALRMKVSAR